MVGYKLMKKEPRPFSDRSHNYLLPASAHGALTQTRDHLRLLAQLTEPSGEPGLDVVYLSARALAQCFDGLADDLDRLVQAAMPSAP